MAGPTSYQEMSSVLTDTLAKLNDLCRSLPMSDAKTSLLEFIETLEDEEDSIVAAQLQESDDQWTAQTTYFTDATGKIEKVKDDIDAYVGAVKTAGDALASLTTLAALIA